MPSESRSWSVPVSGGAEVAGERTGRAGAPVVVLLHAGVADRRAWREVAELLADADLDVIAYDRRGYGQSAPGAAPFTHLADLVAVLDAAGARQAVLVGNSMGGALALDLALTAPERMASVLLVGAAVSGMTDEDTPFDWAPDAASEPLLTAIQQAEARGDTEARVRALLHLWLDGPAQPEGRVGGAPRELAAAMNRRIIEVGAPESAGDAGLDTWARLAEVATPVLATWGEHDIPADLPFYEETARRLPNVEARVLPGTAHLPSLDRPDLVADLIRVAVALGSGTR